MRNRIAVFGFIAAIAVASPGCGGGGASGGVNTARLSIGTAALAPMTVGAPYSQQLAAANGTVPFSWSIVDPATLPPGIALLPSQTSLVTLAGTPTAIGTYTFQVRVQSGNGGQAVRTYTVEVADALTITTTSLVAGKEGDLYTDHVDAAGGRLPYAWTISAGQLPPGVFLLPSSTDSVDIFGTPTDSGTFQFDVRVEDADARVATKTLTISLENIFQLFLFGDLETPGFIELFRATSDGVSIKDLVKINETIIPTNGSVKQFQLSPDKTRLAYIADAEILGQKELYAVDVSTTPPGPAQKVSVITTPNAKGNVNSFLWSPDSKKIAYNADAETDGIYESYVVDFSSGTPTHGKASPGTDVGFTIQDTADETYAWSPDSRFLATLAKDALGKYQLFITDTAGGPPYTPTPVPAVGGSNEVDRLNGWIGTASSPTLLYLIKFGSSTYDLYYVAVPGGVPGTPTLLQGNASNNSTRGLEAAYASPDGKTLAIRAGSLFFSDISSGTPTTPTAVLAGVSGYTWSPDSQFVIANSTANGPRELYTVSATGSAVIYPDFISDVAGWDYDFAPDGKRVWVKDTGANLEALGFLIDLSSPTPGAPEQFSPDPNLQSASGGLATGAPVGNDGRTVVFSPDSTMLAYSFRDNDANEMILYLNDVTGGVLGAPQPITPGLAYTPVANDGATRATWTSDSRFLFMRGNWDARSPYRVYSYDPRSPAPQLRDLTPLLPNGAKGITEFAIRE